MDNIKIEDIYAALEKSFLTYKELVEVKLAENNERMICLDGKIRTKCINSNVSKSTGDKIYVRENIVKLLLKAQEKIDAIMPDHFIEVVYGYRSLNVQIESFNKIKNNILNSSNKDWDDLDLKEEIHRFVAVPEVAGHPTGGAVDVRLVDDKVSALDMGTDAHEFTKESYVFYPFISKYAWLNRQKLRQAMLSVGFAPFDGEWWHFSYGDREWAKYYNKKISLYSGIDKSKFIK